MSKIALDPKTTALILIDLQNGVAGMPLAPLSSAQVISTARTLADYFRGIGAPVVLVNVAYPEGEAAVDFAMPMPDTMPAGWDVLVDGLGQTPNDIRITKSGWGAFTGTDLHTTLQSKGIKTVVVAGIATNFGVESTAREAAGLQYSVIFAADAMTSVSPQHQEFALNNIFPMMGRVRTAEELM